MYLNYQLVFTNDILFSYEIPFDFIIELYSNCDIIIFVICNQTMNKSQASPRKKVSWKNAKDDLTSSAEVCGPFQGEVTCALAGYSSLCTADHIATIQLDLAGESSLFDSAIIRSLRLVARRCLI